MTTCTSVIVSILWEIYEMYVIIAHLVLPTMECVKNYLNNVVREELFQVYLQ